MMKQRTQLLAAITEAHERTLELVADLDDEQMIGPLLAIVNPLRWELGHVAWFYENWLLRHLRGRAPLVSNGDELYNSATIAHDTRWDLLLPAKADTIAYVKEILHQVINADPATEALNGFAENYFLELSLLHECMHAEAFTYTRQTLNYPAPQLFAGSDVAEAENHDSVTGHIGGSSGNDPTAGRQTGSLRSWNDCSGDAFIPGGSFLLGSPADSDHFIFDNERDAHFVTVKPFSIARTATTQAEFLAFVEANGYARPEWWSEAGWQWRTAVSAQHPLYWRREPDGHWSRKNFAQWVALEDNLPVLHVNWHEAEAYCRFAGRRLPTESEWEMAACCEPSEDGDGITEHKRRFPWGDESPTAERANLDWRAMQCVPVNACGAGDSAFGVRQMIGNVWEWTATDFQPFPNFKAGPYKEYSAPWFGDHKVLRGGCWATRSVLIRPTYRNFYKPDRRDVWAGFRTCAL